MLLHVHVTRSCSLHALQIAAAAAAAPPPPIPKLLEADPEDVCIVRDGEMAEWVVQKLFEASR